MKGEAPCPEGLGAAPLRQEGRGEAEPLSAFRCCRCGGCCLPRGYVRLRDREEDAMASCLGVPVAEFLERFTRLTADRRGLSLVEEPDGRCVFLTAAKECRIEEAKPQQCRDFPLRWNYPGFERICRGMERNDEAG